MFISFTDYKLYNIMAIHINIDKRPIENKIQMQFLVLKILLFFIDMNIT